MILQLKRKHFVLGQKFHLGESCPVALAMKEMFPEQVIYAGIHCVYVKASSEEKEHRIIGSYTFTMFESDYSDAKNEDPETIIRELEIPTL